MNNEKETGFDFCDKCVDYSYSRELMENTCHRPFGQISCNHTMYKQKLEICQKYCDLLKWIEGCWGKEMSGFAGKDFERLALHQELCEIFGITHEQCFGITDRLDEINYSPEKLKEKLDELTEANK